jgi:TPR repeat protein
MKPIIVSSLLFVFLLSTQFLAATTELDGLRARAEHGDPDAQYSLGLAFSSAAVNQVSVPRKDDAEALKWIRMAASQGHHTAQGCLGLFYSSGWGGVVRDDLEALKWYRMEAEHGDAKDQLELGEKYSKGNRAPKDSAEAANWFLKAAEQGNPEAQYKLARAYASGDGVGKNNAAALKWLRKAAEGSEPATVDLMAYDADRDKGPPTNDAEATERIRKLAESGDAEAQRSLGWAYSSGYGVIADEAKAVGWYRKAAIQGVIQARMTLAALCFRSNEVAEHAEGKKWLLAAAFQGSAVAQGFLAAYYRMGWNFPKNEVEALAWSYLRASHSPDELSLRMVSQLEEGLGRQGILLAQQRSAEISKEIEINNTRTIGQMPSLARIAGIQDEPRLSGTGTIVTPQGHVLTVAHVVAGAHSVKIFTAQGMKAADVLRVDEANDIAILKIAGGTYTPLPVAPSRKVRLGQLVATIGFPNIGIQGFSPKVTRGEISSHSGVGDDPTSWQISVPIQPGNSGGPLLDQNGNLIGVVQAKLGLKAAKATGDMPQNVNYAVKSAYALALLESFLGDNSPEPNDTEQSPSFEDMIAKAQQSVVLILVY